ncbi:MAG: hypothetical protein U5L04_07415 [Trueperaceae bacterium]|nr:hypothetical protein [Trueperaceae bacterium]
MKTPVDFLEGRVYTTGARIYGGLHPLSGVSVADHMNRSDRAVLPMTDAIMYQRGLNHPPEPQAMLASVPFVAIPKTRVLWILGGYYTPRETGEVSDKEFVAFFEDHFLRGNLRLRKGLRVSDFINNMSHEKPFQRLHDVTLFRYTPGKGLASAEALERFEIVTFNLNTVIATSDLEKLMPPVGRRT